MKDKVIILLVIIIAILFLKNCSTERQLNESKSIVSVLSIEKQNLMDSISNRDGKIVKLQQAVIFENKKGKEELSKYADSVFNLKRKDDKKYKETIAFYQNYINTRLRDTLYIPIDTISNYIGEDTLEYLNNSIRVPSRFELDSNYFSIKGEIQKNNIRLDSLNIPDTLSGRFVVKKNGWFKPKTIEYQTFNTNPYIKIEGGKSAIYKEKKNKIGFFIGIGVGVISTLLITK